MAEAESQQQQQAGGALARRTAADSVRAALMRPEMIAQLRMALPRHLTPERLVRVAMTAVQQTPKLLECDRQSLYAAIMTCAQLGLEPDGVLGQAYLVPFKNRVQFIPGYKGLISLARNSGEVTSIFAKEVCENDDFDYAFGLVERLEHVPAAGDRGEIIGFYAIARFHNGGYHWDYMTRAEVEAIRDGSQGWQAFKAGKVRESPWHTHFAEMGKKTVIRRISKYLPLNVQKAAAIADAYDRGRHGALDATGELVIEEGGGAPALGPQEAAGTALDAFAADQPEDGAAVDATAQEATPADAAPAPGSPPWRVMSVEQAAEISRHLHGSGIDEAQLAAELGLEGIALDTWPSERHAQALLKLAEHRKARKGLKTDPAQGRLA
jgi:recombination protein RecT